MDEIYRIRKQTARHRYRKKDLVSDKVAKAMMRDAGTE